MTSNNIKITIICNDKEYLQQVIDWYNKNYKTDFKITNIILDEVNFAELEASVYKTSDIFDLGYQFGVKEQELRHQGKIDW
ncbi:hypothetical protein [uncultured Tenacibaculum sp.]|uniref:hypothetical protein n=1 Tax=uncultured Tenacibaculum sp. TaxID=174713 RepID=UPI002608BEF2|nr:hypothetical protein [uncultured Tenacibaculum sp.]